MLLAHLCYANRYEGITRYHVTITHSGLILNTHKALVTFCMTKFHRIAVMSVPMLRCSDACFSYVN